MRAPCAQVNALRERLSDATADALAAGGRAEGLEAECAGAWRGGADADLLAVSDGRLQVTDLPLEISKLMLSTWKKTFCWSIGLSVCSPVTQ